MKVPIMKIINMKMEERRTLNLKQMEMRPSKEHGSHKLLIEAFFSQQKIAVSLAIANVNLIEKDLFEVGTYQILCELISI